MWSLILNPTNKVVVRYGLWGVTVIVVDDWGTGDSAVVLGHFLTSASHLTALPSLLRGCHFVMLCLLALFAIAARLLLALYWWLWIHS